MHFLCESVTRIHDWKTCLLCISLLWSICQNLGFLPYTQDVVWISIRLSHAGFEVIGYILLAVVQKCLILNYFGLNFHFRSCIVIPRRQTAEKSILRTRWPRYHGAAIYWWNDSNAILRHQLHFFERYDIIFPQQNIFLF